MNRPPGNVCCRFFNSPAPTITQDATLVQVELRPFNDRMLNRDLVILCDRVNQPSPRLPDGRRLSFTIRSPGCILAAQKVGKIPRLPVYLAYQTDCLPCALREQCLASGAKGDRARRVSAVRRLLPPPAIVEHKPILLGSMRWVDVAGPSPPPARVGPSPRPDGWVLPLLPLPPT